MGGPEQQPPIPEQQQRAPERESATRESCFDFERMPVETILSLGEALGVAATTSEEHGKNRFEKLENTYVEDLIVLPERNIDKAKEVAQAMGYSESYHNRSDAPSLLIRLLRKQQEMNSSQIDDTLWYLTFLYRESDREGSDQVAESATYEMSSALLNGWLRPDIAARINRELIS